MKCETYQRGIVDLLASVDETQMPLEIRSHGEVCAVCREFYETQSRLFRSIDGGIRSLVNQAVPSALYSVPAQLPEGAAEHRHLGVPVWAFGIIGAVTAVLALFIGFHRQQQTVAELSSPARVSQDALESADVNKNSRMEPRKPGRAGIVRKPQLNSRPPQGGTAEKPLEVIVLAEEREAFAKFVAAIPSNENVAVALSRPAPSVPGAPVEIALLQVSSMKVDPLEGTPRD
jgi:hypothetical protein